MAAGGALALVIDAEKVEVCTAKRELHIFVAKQLHARFRKEALGSIFGPGVNLVIAVATENTEGRAKLAYFVNAIGERVGSSGDEISGNNGEIGAEVVSHLHRATDIGAAHITTEVNIAQLDDGH